jgi:hypothetical protein
VAALARLFGASAGVALRTGLYLAQAGEFGFVLLTLGAEHGLVAPQWMSPVLASMVLSMLATPFIIMYSNRIVMRLSSQRLAAAVGAADQHRQALDPHRGHVIICGYGRSGQNLARLLDQEHIPYMALDLDPDRVRQAAAAGQSVVFGDAARLQSLMAAGLARASRGGGQLPRHAVGAEDPAAGARARAEGAGDRAHDRRHRPGAAARRRRHRGGARGDRGLADAGQPCAGAGGRADAPRDPPDARRARCALRPAARLLPRRRRRHRPTSCSRPACSA